MKLTNKILLAVLILTLIGFTVFRIMFNNRVELVPEPFKHGMIDTAFTVGRISAFEIKGNYSVDFIKSDFDSIKINGPDNLVETYTKIEGKGETLSITSQTDLSKYPLTVKIRIYTKDIESVHASGGAIMTLEDFSQINLVATAEDSSIVNAESCSFTNVKAYAKDKAVISIENTVNAIVNIKNTSSVFLTVDDGEITGTRDDGAELILLGKIKMNKVVAAGEEIAKGGTKHE